LISLQLQLAGENASAKTLYTLTGVKPPKNQKPLRYSLEKAIPSSTCTFSPGREGNKTFYSILLKT